MYRYDTQTNIKNTTRITNLTVLCIEVNGLDHHDIVISTFSQQLGTRSYCSTDEKIFN